MLPLDYATPNKSEGSNPLMNKHLSQVKRQVGWLILLRNLKPTGRRIKASNTSSMAK